MAYTDTRGLVNDLVVPSTAPAVATAKKTDLTRTEKVSPTPSAKSPANAETLPQPNENQDSSATSAQCEQSTTAAASCCRSPDSCLTGQEQDQVKNLLAQAQMSQGGGGLNSLAQSSSSLNDVGAQVNGIYSTACYRSKMACTQACQSSSSSARSVCSGLSAGIYSEQSVANAAGSGMSDIGNLATQAAMPNQGNTNDPYGCQKNPSGAACQQCTQAPNSPACQAMAAKASAQQGQLEQGSAGFRNASATDTKNNFNLGGADFTGAGPGFNGAAGAAGGDNVPQVKPVANNSGGGIPGGEAGSGQGAKLNGGRQGGGSSPGAPGISTDIDQGFRGGGGYAGTGGGTEMTEASGGGSGRGRGAGGGRGPAGARIDLKQYLPGGRYDPTRLGGMQTSSVEIHGPHVDIWGCIHDRIIEKCRLGELYDCGL